MEKKESRQSLAPFLRISSVFRAVSWSRDVCFPRSSECRRICFANRAHKARGTVSTVHLEARISHRTDDKLRPHPLRPRGKQDWKMFGNGRRPQNAGHNSGNKPFARLRGMCRGILVRAFWRWRQRILGYFVWGLCISWNLYYAAVTLSFAELLFKACDVISFIGSWSHHNDFHIENLMMWLCIITSKWLITVSHQ